MGVLYACKGAHTVFTGQRERKRVRKRVRKREREKESEKEGERESIFLTGMMGALAPFSYPVVNKW